MEDREQSRVASVLTVLVGTWLLISPIWIAISDAALVSLLVVGVVMVAAGFVQYFTESMMPSWIIGVAAAWLFMSTFIFGVSTVAAYSQIIAAIAAFALAYWDGMEIMHVHDRRHPVM
jgi:hypothetical protein